MRPSGQANRPNGRTDGIAGGNKRTHALTLGYRGTNRVCTCKEISSVRRVSSGRWSEREARQTQRLVHNDSIRTRQQADAGHDKCENKCLNVGSVSTRTLDICVCAIQYTSVMRKGKYDIRSCNIEYSGKFSAEIFRHQFLLFDVYPNWSIVPFAKSCKPPR